MSSGALNPLENPDSWDVLVIAGRPTPGICEIDGDGLVSGWDVKKGKGAQGATLTYTGREPQKFSATFSLWTVDDFLEWEEIRPLLKYDPTKKAAQALEIFHPALADLGLNAVVVEKITPIKHVGERMYEFTIDFIEYLPPPKKSAVSTPGKVEGGGDTAPKQTPGDTPDPALVAAQKGMADVLDSIKAQGPV